MKILHICLANFYYEGMGYQENILPAYHVKAGHDVIMFTSDKVFNSANFECDGNQYINGFGALIKSVKQKESGWLSRYRDYENLCGEIEEVNPDLIFVHGGQFVALNQVVKYVKKHKNVKLYLDQHADYYNTPVDTLRKRIAATVLFGYFIRRAIGSAEKFWGVTPWRCQYLNEIYGVPKNKIGLLTMGGDDDKIDFENQSLIRQKLREELNLEDDDFVIVTGGKIDKAKNIHLLMKAVRSCDEAKLKLVVFGNSMDVMKDEIATLADSANIRYIGWIPSDKVYDYFLMSDLAVFPGTHSVLWEQACACGLPALFKDWCGMRHVNVNGNSDFLYKDSEEEIKNKIIDIYSNREKYNAMKSAAEECKEEFFYSKIAEKAIK